jgi:hypothetical protein
VFARLGFDVVADSGQVRAQEMPKPDVSDVVGTATSPSL